MSKVKDCPTCKAPDPWSDWREAFKAEQVKRRAFEGRARHLEACLRKLVVSALGAIQK